MAKSLEIAARTRRCDRLDHPRRGDRRLYVTVEGGTDAAAFEAYVEHFLAPLR